MAEYLSGVRVEFVLDPLDGVGWVVVAAIWYDDMLELAKQLGNVSQDPARKSSICVG